MEKPLVDQSFPRLTIGKPLRLRRDVSAVQPAPPARIREHPIWEGVPALGKISPKMIFCVFFFRKVKVDRGCIFDNDNDRIVF